MVKRKIKGDKQNFELISIGFPCLISYLQFSCRILFKIKLNFMSNSGLHSVILLHRQLPATHLAICFSSLCFGLLTKWGFTSNEFSAKLQVTFKLHQVSCACGTDLHKVKGATGRRQENGVRRGR